MEDIHLLRRDPPNERRTRASFKALAALVVLASCVIAVQHAARRRSSPALFSETMLPHQTAAPTAESQPVPRPTAAPTAEPHPVPHPTSIRIVVTNEYGGQPLSIGRGMYPNISAVVEPFRYSNMTLHHAGELAGPVVWSVHDATSDTTVVDAVVTTSSSHAIAHEFTDPSHVYVISAVDRASGSATALRVTCKYVRRELHTLTADDRERYLAALATVYHTREAEGKQQFGDRFTSGEWFARWHLGESGVPSTGQNTAWHSAPSFFTAHASLVLMMERSLQSIDPRVAAHYWDYTIDSELYGASDGGDWSGTFYFSDEWFGPMPGASASANNDMAVGEIRGRFAGIEIERNFSQPTHNSYGLLTGPYNNNDARVLTRALSVCGMPTTNIPLPGCQALLATFKQGTMSDFDIHSEAALHAMLHVQPRRSLGGYLRVQTPHSHMMHCLLYRHVLFGGAWGCKEDLRSFAAVHPAIAKALGDFVHFYNGMLMVSTSTEELTCPGYCSEDTPFDNCLCSCPFLDHSSVNLTRFTQHHLEVQYLSVRKFCSVRIGTFTIFLEAGGEN